MNRKATVKERMGVVLGMHALDGVEMYIIWEGYNTEYKIRIRSIFICKSTNFLLLPFCLGNIEHTGEDG